MVTFVLIIFFTFFTVNAGVDNDQKLSEFLEAVYDRAWAITSGSSNLLNKSTHLNQKNGKTTQCYTGHYLSEFRRWLQLYAIRASLNPNLTDDQKNLIKQIYQWNLDFCLDETCEYPIEKRYVKLNNGEIKTIESIRQELEILNYYSLTKECLEQSALEGITGGIANCSEYSNIIYAMLAEYDPYFPNNIPMEIIQCKEIDHQFVVVNRNQESDIHNPIDWGEDCFLVDPWWQIFGKVSKYLGTITQHMNYNFSFYAIISGYIGEGHSKQWPHGFQNIFTSEKYPLLLYQPKKRNWESIPFAFKTSQEDEQYRLLETSRQEYDLRVSLGEMSNVIFKDFLDVKKSLIERQIFFITSYSDVKTKKERLPLLEKVLKTINLFINSNNK